MKKMLFLILAAAITLSAAFVPVDRARTVAENQYKQYCADATTKSATVVNVVENRYEGEVTWYAFEFEKGFVIVSADDSVRPILGYSDHGKVPKADKLGGQNFKEWFGKYDREIAFMRKNNVVDKAGAQTWKDIEANVFSSSKASVIVDRLVKSEWDQVWPWNDDCPVKGDDGAFTYVGCVATAMAQITRYHKWPDVGVGSASYSWNNDVSNITLSATFSSHTWNYDLMPEVNAYEYGLYPEYWEDGITQAEVDELALQSYWMGLSVNMDYGDDADGGSGAYSSDVDNAFIDHWKGTSTYSSFSTPTAGGVDGSYATIKAQLDAKRPWYWSGGVHAFVLDGYRDDYWYHFNWGWAGSYDGWFHRSSLIPDGSGSGGGDGDYTSGQSGATYVPSTDPFTAWTTTTVSGSVANGEDITVSWTAQTGAVEYELYRTFNKEGVPTLLTTTTSLSYQDIDCPAGEYAYHVIVVYSGGKSHNSNVYSTTIDIISDYKYPTALTATSVGRTSIDLTWVKPYTGVSIMTQGWESGSLDSWTLRSSYAYTSTINNKGWVADDGTRWGIITAEDLGDGGDAYIHDGIYANYIGYNAGSSGAPLSWLISPQFTMGAGYTWESWVWYNNNSPTGSGLWPTDMYFVWYTGSYSERTGTQIAANTDIIEFWDGSVLAVEDSVNWGNNKYESMVSFDLSSYSGTGSLAFVYSYTDGYQAAVDDIVVGAPTGGSTEPTGYEVYRDGSLVQTISGPTNISWSDTGFADGNNTYFVRATYPTGTSIPSLKKTEFIDANPKPYYLSGVAAKGTVDLAWYQPYKNPPMWYCYYDVNKSTTTIDMMDVAAPLRRVEFGTDAGYYYPVTIDSVGAYFYDWDEGNWGGENTYIIRIVAMGFYAVGGGFLPDTVLWESGTLTATHLQMDKIALPTPMVRTKKWAVEVEALGASTGNPGNLAGPSPDGYIHSFFYYSVEDSYDYYMITGGEPAEYAILTHLTSSDPPEIAKSSWVTASDLERPTSVPGYTDEDIVKERFPMADPKNKTISGSVTSASKAMDYYKIYRNGSEIGTSTTLTYSDTTAPAGDNTYYVTAVYSNPTGESAGSNEVIVSVQDGGPEVPTNVVTSISGSDIKIDWDDMSAAEYVVYYSDDPYGTYSQLTTVTATTYTYTGTESKMFFYIVSSDGTKQIPKTIKVKKTSTR